MKIDTFDVIGMTCAACQAAVTRSVSKVDGVKNVDVSLLSNSMKVEYDPETTTPAQIEQAVAKAGYEAALPQQVVSETNSAGDAWEKNRKRMEQEARSKKQTLIVSIVLLCVLLCFSMLPMLGIFTFLMDMKWMMIDGIIQLFLTMLILFAQRSFFIHGFKALIKRNPNMDSLVAVGSAVSFLYGMYGLLTMAYGYGVMDHEIIHGSMDALYFESAAMIVTLVSLGKYLEARSKSKTGDALARLIDLAPKTALIEKDGVEMEIPADNLVPGDIVIIKPGMSIPADGIVSSGTGYVDQAAITGESIPVEKQPGDSVMSATTNVNGSFRFEAVKTGGDTTLSQIIRLVEEAGNSKAPIARLADKVSGIFVPTVMLIAVIVFIVWLIAGRGFGFALNCAVSVLVISCPCALGLATPLAIMVSTGKAAENGILIKSAEALETLQSVNTVVLDKTGTITNGKPVVTQIELWKKDLMPDTFLSLAAAAEAGSEHPLGKAVVDYAVKSGIPARTASEFSAVSGRGLQASVDGTSISAGNAAFMKEEHILLTAAQKQSLDEAAGRGQTPLIFAFDGIPAGMICVADTVRDDSRDALKLLNARGIETIMLTGDNEKTANAVAKDLDVSRVIADVLPADKESVIRSLQEQGKKVAMVGDGINDAPALARADVGIAISAGTDIAIDSADLVLMKDSLLDVVTAYDLSKKTIQNIRENLFWAFFYNVLGIPLAAGVFYPIFGWLLNPMFGAAAMSLSSVTVCLNALRLRLFKPTASVSRVQEKKNDEWIKAEITRLESQDEELEELAEQEEQDSVLLNVQGMTCPNCVRHVKEALESVPGVEQAEVSLDNEQALVLEKEPVNPDALIKAVQEAGYTASLKENWEKEQKLPEEEDQAEAVKLQVEGMGCQNCVRHVKEALEEVPGVLSVQVSLENQEAGVEYEKPAEVSSLIQAVKDAGYDASVKSALVTEKIKVDGMMCEHCVQHVTEALESLDGVQKVSVTLDPPEAVIESEQPLKTDIIKKTLEEAGYSLASDSE